MSAFDLAFAYTMEWEGGDTLTNDSSDPGGLTKYGISKRSNPDIDIANLDEAGAKRIYKKRYWDVMNLDSVTKDRVAIKVFDAGVNIGCKRAVRLAQRAYNDMVSSDQLEDDGIPGPKTVEAFNSMDEDAFFLFYVNHLSQYYRALENPKYLKGWLRRAGTLPK